MDIDSARQSRTNCKTRLTKFKTFLDKCSNDQSHEIGLEEIRLRLKKIEETWDEFDRAQKVLELLAPGPNREVDRTEFEDIYFRYAALATKIISERLPQHSTLDPNTSQNQILQQRTRIEQLEAQLTAQREAEIANLRDLASSRSTFTNENLNTRRHFPLPKLDLPTFSGGYEEWLGFRDAFVAIIHDDDTIPNIQKLRYLRSYLKDGASRVIENLQTSDANYEVAWNLLNERYNNTRIIIQNHMQSLFDIQSLTNKESASGLRNLLDTILRHVRALQVLGEPTEKWDTPLICLIAAKLDRDSRREWERSVRGSEMPKYDRLIEFLRERCQILETLNFENSDRNKLYSKPNNKSLPTFDKKLGKTLLNTQSTNVLCFSCDGDHYIQNCEQFLKMSPSAKIQVIKKKGLCFNCLKRNHLIADCKSSNCTICNRRHHTVLHLDSRTESKSQQNNSSVGNSNQVKSLHIFDSSKVMLSTALVDMFDRDKNKVTCRVLLDSGSQPNLITREFVDRLNLERRKLESSVEVINSQEINTTEWVSIRFRSRKSNYSMKLNFLVIPKITSDLPAVPVNKNILKIPNKVKLADPHFDRPARVEALIGGEIFYELLRPDQIPLALPKTTLQNTHLGWIVTGKISSSWNHQRLSCNLIRDPLSTQLENFWKIENTENKKHLSMEEEACERHFCSSVQRDTSGRYVVRLPFNEKREELGSSYDIARKRFFALEKRLDRDAGLRGQYLEFMKVYEEMDHMQLLSSDDKGGYYIPHQAVVRESSLTTKLRVVFDASARSNSGISLNDTLMVGPSIQDSIFELVLRFRRHSYVMSADIEKMFRQFWIHPDDRNFQKILWRYNEKDPLRTYQLNTVTYGTSSAPYLATRCLEQLAEDEGKSMPGAAEVLKNDFYMDDLLTGADTIREARRLRDDLIIMTGKAGLRLCKWVANDAGLIEDLPDCANEVRQRICEDPNMKTLGVSWNCVEDTLSFETNIDRENKPISKRVMLSQIAQIYDPLGLLAPVVVFSKIKLQDLWKQNLGWDDPVPAELLSSWQDFRNQLELVNSWKIPRAVKIVDHKDLQLHGFADASEKAYGACIYVRSSNEKGIQSILLCAKSRVAPVKTVTLPRLELCAAVLLVKLYQVVKGSLKMKFDKIGLWSDSTIVLNWINTPPHTLKTFVANRVSEIQEFTSAEDWKHVPTKENPADAISRGQLPVEFLNNNLWKSGPEWLCQPESAWPNYSLKKVDVPEKKGPQVFTIAAINRPDLWKRYSSLTKLIRVIAYCLRFIKGVRKQKSDSSLLTVGERRDALKRIIQIVQQEELKDEIKALTTGRELPKCSKIITLSPFLENGILRVGGRIRKSDIEYEIKHPILLPKKHPVTDLIVRDSHEKTMHAGSNATLYLIRKNYWIIDGRAVVRRIIHACVKCFRAKPRESHYIMGDLPKIRINSCRPFENTGVDYCGYFYIKEKKHRNRNKIKVYVAVFVCMVTKAVHMEVVCDLTTEAFLGALRRFFSRRGKSRALYSDNATNFLGADNELKALHNFINSEKHNNKIKEVLAEQEIEWHFIPPRTPHFGGIWEAAVKSLKHHMRRTIGEKLFTFEELSTYMCEIEAVLNSRPLTPMSSDPNDLQVLTPGHFLIGQPLLTIPSLDFTQVPTNRLSSWQHIQKLKLDLWQRWKNEYLTELNVKSKWHTGQKELIKLGSLVVIKEDNLPPLRWALGRVVEVHPGDDGVIRVVTLKTERGELKRGVKKLSPLPIETNNEES